MEPVVGVVASDKLITLLKKNMSIILQNYYGIDVPHYRRNDDTRDLYFDNVYSQFTFLGLHLMSIDSHDFDMLKNDILHVENEIPLKVYLDPEVEWKEHDEVLIPLDTEEAHYSRRFELVDVRSVNKNGITIYRTSKLAPVRITR